ncbi:MAG TPA: ClpXP protease specificity-enhancing factor SspB [Bradyrhizobium sp.]|nr:ClpXP protease specificity-enhancing factor SspB [Bradyrhizobium sp.]
MAVDHIRYDILAQDALRGVVRQVLTDAAKKGLPGEHHFFITFDPRASGVRLSARMREQYPEEMTVVLQHQFWDLKVTEDHFEVGLSFGGVPENLLVPFDAIRSFFDPSIQFGLQFETIAEAEQPGTAPAKADKRDKPKAKPRLPARHEPAPANVSPAPAATQAAPPPGTDAANAPDKPAGEVVQLDRFRKK